MFSWGPTARLTVHLHVRKHWLTVRVVPRHGESVQIEGAARAAVRQSNRGTVEIVGIGNNAAALVNAQDVTVHDAFCHPRVLLGGFDDAQLVVGEFLRQAFGGKAPLLPFPMLIYIEEELEGGLTDIEERAFQELGLRLGAKSVVVVSE